jgi:glycosyltransferase involved in cell wall biosynthesis
MSNVHRKGYDANVFVSKKARELAGVSDDASVIHNGVDPLEYPLFTAKGEYLLWLSRVVSNKGPKEAIEAARATKKQLHLIGFIPKLPKHIGYYDTFIKPFLSDQITLEETVPFQEKVAAYQHAKAFLFPIQWEEPFGLVMIEAMSCGTPVIAFARGAVPEIVEDGVSGFIVNPSDDDIREKWVTHATGQAGLQEAIEHLYSLRADQYTAMCTAARARVEEHFSIDRLVTQYEQLYIKLAEKGKKRYFA